MKGYSATTIISIIVAVIIGVFILYVAWSKGLLPFSSATSEAECKARLAEECQRAAKQGWKPEVFTANVKGCKAYVTNKNAFDCCVNGKCNDYKPPTGEIGTGEVACEDMCREFV